MTAGIGRITHWALMGLLLASIDFRPSGMLKLKKTKITEYNLTANQNQPSSTSQSSPPKSLSLVLPRFRDR